MTIERTREILAKHHRDGAWFADLMRETYAGRFNDEFWNIWQEMIDPMVGEHPTFVDLGSGPALFLRDLRKRYPNAHLVGVECAPYMLEAMGELPDNCEIVNQDLHDPHLPLADGSVDAVVASVVLHEMSQPLRTMQEVLRCLKPGGRFYILDWVRTPLQQYIAAEAEEEKVFSSEISVDELDDLFTHFIEHNRFSADDLAYMLEKTGYRVIEKSLLKEGRFARLIAQKS